MVVVIHAGDSRFILAPIEAAHYSLKPDESLAHSEDDGKSRRPGAIVYYLLSALFRSRRGVAV